MSQTLTIASAAAHRRRPEFTIGDKLLKARVTAGLTQNGLSDIIGVSQTAISSAETGQSTPHRSTIMLWAAATDVDLDWLLESLPRRTPRASTAHQVTRKGSANKV
ncbi:helix-turn-helix domain-containing protein, partial [Agromyces sp. CCNWLW203]|uniref:helix-turn-helix domain-containing protein n=1 Tax=Agromyces sp. CCNWLW203 TaxID=3112842 RepID=UPI002F96E636